MQAGIHSKLIAALLAPVLLASGATQGLLFMRCGSTVRMSCCCPKEAPAPAFGALTHGTGEACGTIAIPSVPAQNVERLVPLDSPPILVAARNPFPSVWLVDEQVGRAPDNDSRPGWSRVLANCSFLI